MADRLGRIDGASARQGEHRPAGVALALPAPVERRRPLLLLHQGPAVGEPEFGAAIAPVVDEGEVFAGGDETARQAARLQARLGAGPPGAGGGTRAVPRGLAPGARNGPPGPPAPPPGHAAGPRGLS